MPRRSPPLFSSLLPACLAACAPPAAPVASLPAPSADAPTPASSPGARVFTAPPDRCTQPAPATRVAPIFDDAGPLTVKPVPAGISLESGGATAARVLLAIAETARVPMHVEGFGASVRIYAHVAGLPRDALIASVIQAAGLVTYRQEGSEPVVLDLDEAERRRRSWVLANLQLATTETRLAPARHPVELGAVLAALLLPCRGEIVAAPERALLMLRADAGALNHMDALSAALEASPAKHFQLDVSGTSAHTVPEPDRRGCEAIAAKPAPDLPRGKLSSQGAAAGALIREIARVRGRDVVVGCGGDRPAFFRGEGELDPEPIAWALGLARLGDGVYGSREMLSRRRLQEIAAERKEPPYLVRVFVVPGAAELALAAERLIQPVGAAVVYAPASAVVVGATPPLMRLVEELVAAWRP